MKRTRASAPKQPSTVCFECGTLYACEKREGASSYHQGRCDVCHEVKQVTDPRDFGYLNRDWVDHNA